MRVINIHERALQATMEEVGKLIDSLASPRDLLWPTQSWPCMKFDRPLGVGATGGHGPIGYSVEDYLPGRRIRFRFLRPKGFEGYHEFDVREIGGNNVVLRHRLEMTTTGRAVLAWPLVFRPLHDALIEDALTRAQASLGLEADLWSWSARVRFLRWLVGRGRARKQTHPTLMQRSSNADASQI
jgi:hypothetical protein